MNFKIYGQHQVLWVSKKLLPKSCYPNCPFRDNLKNSNCSRTPPQSYWPIIDVNIRAGAIKNDFKLARNFLTYQKFRKTGFFWIISFNDFFQSFFLKKILFLKIRINPKNSQFSKYSSKLRDTRTSISGSKNNSEETERVVRLVNFTVVVFQKFVYSKICFFKNSFFFQKCIFSE